MISSRQYQKYLKKDTNSRLLQRRWYAIDLSSRVHPGDETPTRA
jgi:hypothetical protein